MRIFVGALMMGIFVAGCSTHETRPHIRGQFVADSELSKQLQRSGAAKLAPIPQIGLQATSGSQRLQFGGDLSFEHLHIGENASPANGNVNTISRLQNTSIGPVLRFYAVDRRNFRWDLHVGSGIGFAGLRTLRASGETNENLLAAYKFYGTGFSFGSKHLYVTLEGGHRTVEFKGFESSLASGITLTGYEMGGYYAGIAITFTDRVLPSRSPAADDSQPSAPRAEEEEAAAPIPAPKQKKKREKRLPDATPTPRPATKAAPPVPVPSPASTARPDGGEPAELDEN